MSAEAESGLVPLTEDEHKAMQLTAELVNLVSQKVIGKEDTRAGDLYDVVFHVHAIQRMIMANAAARCYPTLYRPLGGNVQQS